MAANKKHTAKVAWFDRGKYTSRLFRNILEAQEWVNSQALEPEYIGEASWSEHRSFKHATKGA